MIEKELSSAGGPLSTLVDTKATNMFGGLWSAMTSPFARPSTSTAAKANRPTETDTPPPPPPNLPNANLSAALAE